MVGYKLSNNDWVTPFFVIFRSVREILLVTVFLEHPVAEEIHFDEVSLAWPGKPRGMGVSLQGCSWKPWRFWFGLGSSVGGLGGHRPCRLAPWLCASCLILSFTCYCQVKCTFKIKTSFLTSFSNLSTLSLSFCSSSLSLFRSASFSKPMLLE